MLLFRSSTRPLARTLCALALLGIAAAAVQPLYRVDAEVVYLPRDGVALNAHTGRVLWRFPRFDGDTQTDGHGLLLVSWVAMVQPQLRRRVTRFCRIRTSDGKQLWCRDWAGVEQWTLDAAGKFWYIHTPGRFRVLRIGDGQSDHSFPLHDDARLALMPLPEQGVLLLERASHAAVALSYRPGAAVLTAESVPSEVYPFRGNGPGLLLYTREKHDFFLAAPLKLLLHGAGAAFPRVSLDGSGFLFTDLQGDAPVVRGGTYAGPLWQAPRAAGDPRLAVTSATAVELEPVPHEHASRLRGWDLASGQLAYDETLNGEYPVLASADGALVLQSDRDLRLLQAANGEQRWQVALHAGSVAAIARTAVLFWDDGGGMVALARSNGALLWRVHFESVWWRSEQSGRQLPPGDASPQATNGSDLEKGG
ncbi:MAG: PQQ-binding-like beta-propeller repeat protein [Terriglobales bacterium]